MQQPMDKPDELETFIEQVFEIAFGNEALSKGYTHEEVLEQIRQFSDVALLNDFAKEGLSQQEINTLLCNKPGGMFAKETT